MKKLSMNSDLAIKHVRQAFIQAENAINVTDLTGVMVAVNQAYLDLYGFKHEDDVLGETQAIIRSPKNAKSIYEEMWSTIKKDSTWKGELFNRNVEGEDIPVYLSIHPLFEGGKKVAYMGFTMDRSQQVELEKQLLHTNRLAVLGVLGAGLAHELNNPLTSISLEAENLRDQLREEVDPNKAQVSSVETILKGVDRMQRVISHLLVYVRKGSQVGEESIDLKDLTTDARLFLERQFHNRNISIDVSIEKEMWIEGRRTDMESVFHNLLTNSRDAFDENEERLSSNHQITITAHRPEEGWIEIVYKDNAGGIPKELLTKIFDPFFTTKKEGSGTGLGLSISSKIIKEHKGSLRVCVEGEVTLFKILIPSIAEGKKKGWLDDF